MKVIVREERIVNQVEYAFYEVEVPEDIAKARDTEEGEDAFNEYVAEHYYDNYAYDYECGDIIDVYTESWEIERIEV
jgi:hypothetical protein